jgi:hypothetical protein
MMVRDVDLQVKRVWIRQRVVELNNSPICSARLASRVGVITGPLNWGFIGTGPPPQGQAGWS